MQRGVFLVFHADFCPEVAFSHVYNSHKVDRFYKTALYVFRNCLALCFGVDNEFVIVKAFILTLPASLLLRRACIVWKGSRRVFAK